MLWIHQPFTLKAEQPKSRWPSEIVMVEQMEEKLFHYQPRLTKAASLCTNAALSSQFL